MQAARLMEMLGLPSATDLTSNEVRKAYLRVCLKIHPDKCSELRAEEAFNALDTLYKAVVPMA